MKRILLPLAILGVGIAGALFMSMNSAVQLQTHESVTVPIDAGIADTAEGDTTGASPEVIAYYFHTTYRCTSCKKIEAYSKEAIEVGFAEELRSGRLKFESVNIQEDKNKHFIDDFNLYTKSLVICDIKDGRQVDWKNLTKVWLLLRNKDEFLKYVQDEINVYLKES